MSEGEYLLWLTAEDESGEGAGSETQIDAYWDER